MKRVYMMWALGLAGLLAFLPGCATTGKSGDGVVVLGEAGKDKSLTPEEVDQMSGSERPYFLQVGDVVNIDFKLRNAKKGETPWDYRIEVGDSMEARLMPGAPEPGEYKLEVGDVIGISFLDNWQMNVTRTLRVDGMISAPEIGDVKARGLTPLQLRDLLIDLYKKSQIVEGNPRITVNVDFVNLDRYEEMSRDVVVRPDGAISLPNIKGTLRIAGMTVAEASELISKEAAKTLQNKPNVSLVIFPAVETTALKSMSGAVQVRPDGRISVPRIGEVQAAGFSVQELKEAVIAQSKDIAVNPIDPSIDVLKSTGGRIYVGGEVRNPGVYPLEGSPSALQAVITANGFVDSSRMNDVIVVRRNPNGKPYVFRTNLRVALMQGHTDNDILLRPFDTVYVPKKTIAKLDQWVSEYIDKLVPFDNSMGVNAQYYMNTQKIETKGKSLNFNTGATGVLDVLNP